jgi:hypothetical protein
VNLSDIRDFVVVPGLKAINLAEPNRVQLVIGTGSVESGGYNYLDQTTPGPGPAYGFWQMEKATHDDLWRNYIAYQPSAFRETLWRLAGAQNLSSYIPPIDTLHWNLRYAAAMCGVHYRRAKGALPVAGDARAMAAYWKQWYNTPLGKGTEAKALPYFQEACKL